MQTLDTLYRRALIRAALSMLAFTVAMLALLYSTAPQAQTVAQWQAANEQCRGSTRGIADPACKRAGAIARALYAKDMRLGQHEVWYTHDQYTAFAVALNQAQRDIAPALATQSVYTLIPTAYQRLRAAMPDDVMFAIWNDFGDSFRQIAPGGSAIMLQMLQQVSNQHASSNDVRYFIDGQ
jgi:hypothetical protein